MLLELRNFRCHRKGKWEFPSSGLCLLSGPRGGGKTTLLEGILYALYGPPAVRKVVSFGETKSLVKLSIGPLNITRTSKPRKLVVLNRETKKKYEGEKAQSIIEDWLGMNLTEFRYACYINQKSNGSILSLPPQEQLNCIEKIALSGNDHKVTQASIRDKIKEVESSILKVECDHEVHEKVCQNLQQSLEDYTVTICPVDLEKGEKYSKKIRENKEKERQQIEDKIAQIKGEWNQLSQERDKLREKDESVQALRTTKQGITSIISRIERDLESLTDFSDLNTETIADNERQLSEFGEKICWARLGRELQNKKSELDLFLRENERDINEELRRLIDAISEFEKTEEEIGSLLQHSYSSSSKPKFTREEALQELKKCIPVFRKQYDIPSSVRSVNQVVKQLKEKYLKFETTIQAQTNSLNLEIAKNEITSKSYKCPQCEADLKFENDSLISITQGEDEKIDKEEMITSLMAQIEENSSLSSELKTAISSVELLLSCASEKRKYISPEEATNLQKDLSSLSSLNAQKRSLELRKKNLNECETVRRIQADIERIEKQIPSDFDLEIDLEKLEFENKALTSKLTEYYSQKTRLNGLQLEKKEKENQLRAIERKLVEYGRLPSLRAIEKQVEGLRLEIEELQNTLMALTITIQNCLDFEKYLLIQAKIEGEKEEISQILRKKKDHEENHKTLLKLREYAAKAEHIAIQQVIEDINRHSEHWLDQMFDKDPISIRLESVKETKGGEQAKLQMNVRISYKGHKYEGVNQLSGGERDQANLAFVLGVNSMIGGKIIMLDESLSSLDEETNNETVMLLKDLVLEKPIIVVSHEATKGVFDSEIKA